MYRIAPPSIGPIRANIANDDRLVAWLTEQSGHEVETVPTMNIIDVRGRTPITPDDSQWQRYWNLIESCTVEKIINTGNDVWCHCRQQIITVIGRDKFAVTRQEVVLSHESFFVISDDTLAVQFKLILYP
jgi:hypothetical protein